MSSQQTSEKIPYLTACPKLLALLGQFHPAGPAVTPLDARVVDPKAIPQPYGRLLVHSSDMTSTLTAFHGEPLRLRVLNHVLTPTSLSRHVLLVGQRSRCPVEYGAIRIDLDAIPEPVRDEVIECRTPLGGILRAHGVPFRSCPGAFFEIRSTELIGRVLELNRPGWLFGRCGPR